MIHKTRTIHNIHCNHAIPQRALWELISTRDMRSRFAVIIYDYDTKTLPLLASFPSTPRPQSVESVHPRQQAHDDILFVRGIVYGTCQTAR